MNELETEHMTTKMYQDTISILKTFNIKMRCCGNCIELDYTVTGAPVCANYDGHPPACHKCKHWRFYLGDQ